MFNSAAVGNFASRGACSPCSLPYGIRSPFFRGSAVSCAMSVERCDAAHDERRRSHHHKKTHRLELSGHNLTPHLIPERTLTQSEPPWTKPN